MTASPPPPRPLPRVLDDEWEPPPRPSRVRVTVIAACSAIALVVTGVKLLKSRERTLEPNDLNTWVASRPAPAPAAPSPAAGLRADFATAPTLSNVDPLEPNDGLESPRRSTPRPRAAPPANRRDGYLSINSSPWAELSVDGRVVGNTPQVRIRVPAGRHHLLLARPGFYAHSAWVNVPAGGTVRLTDITLAGVVR